PVLHLDQPAVARRSRRVADLQRAGPANDRPAPRALDLDRNLNDHSRYPDCGAARRDRGVEAWHLDRSLRDGIVGARLLRAGVRAGLRTDPAFRDRSAWAAGAGLQEHHRRSWPLPGTPGPADANAVAHLCGADCADDTGCDA